MRGIIQRFRGKEGGESQGPRKKGQLMSDLDGLQYVEYKRCGCISQGGQTSTSKEKALRKDDSKYVHSWVRPVYSSEAKACA